jgi:hypothetical protein
MVQDYIINYIINSFSKHMGYCVCLNLSDTTCYIISAPMNEARGITVGTGSHITHGSKVTIGTYIILVETIPLTVASI